MSQKPYKAKSLSGAQRRVRQLESLRRETAVILDHVWKERNALAKLCADGPCFDNPLEAMAAKQIRDDVLKNHCRLKPDGTRI